MKRNFLLLCAFFLTSCSSAPFYENTGCPVENGKQISVLFEYGSAELNETAVQQIKKIAQNVKKDNQYVCFLGRLSYQGGASYQALGAIDRIRNTAAVFLSEGVDPMQIYMGIASETPRIGFSEPQTANQEEHKLDLLIGK